MCACCLFKLQPGNHGPDLFRGGSQQGWIWSVLQQVPPPGSFKSLVLIWIITLMYIQHILFVLYLGHLITIHVLML